ncbi:MAG: leucine-rich repeat protein [Lachnospiraceae bacterium]|nr:leucine-rich repeat protein [Lachnospiraceae bacterium]
MKKTKDRHMNDQTVKRHARRRSCFKRAGVLLLSILVWLTSDPSIMDAFTVRAEEENNLKCVITSFLPLSEEVAQQSVCVGTPMEELLLPDTLEAVCTYEDDQESSSDDIEKEDSEEEEKTPEKPKPDDQIPSESEDGDEIPEEPEQDDQSPTESENSDQTSPEAGNGDQTPSGPEDDDQTPKAPEEGDGTPETPDANGNTPETPEQGGLTSSKPEETDSTAEESEQGGQNAEESVTNMGGNADGSDANSSAESTGAGSIDSLAANHVNTLTDEMSYTENTVYVDKLESMISAVRDKAFSLLGGVSIEATQVTMETNLTEPEEEVEVQVLTNIVTIDSVTWEGIFEYDSELAGCYIFTPVLPEGFLLADDVALPEIVVIVMEEEAEIGTAKTQAISVQAVADTSGTCGASLTWEYADGTLKIIGSGAMDDFDIAPWNEYANDINYVSIDEGVTTIGNYAFFDCVSLETIDIPGSITSIGTAAFFGCSSLGSVTIPNGVASIGSLAFNGCSKLGVVEIPDTVKTITAYTFRNCSNAIIYYPASLSGLGDTKDTKANISYTDDGGLTTLKIVSVGSDVSAIHFPETIGGADVGAANWDEYEGIEITHDSFPEHRYTDSSECTICGEQKAPEIKIDFLREKLIGFEQGKTYTYSIAGTSGTLSNSTELDIKENWFGKEISIALQNAGSSTGKTQKLPIPARPKGPTGITTSNVTSNGDDGKLLNVSSDMEYWKKGASPEVIVGITGDTVENLPAGTYCVRFKAVENTSFSSEAVEVVIGEYEPVPEKTPTAKIDYINESLIGLDAGDTYHIVCGTTKADMTAKTDGSIPFPSDESWFGKKITIVKNGKSPGTIDSEAFELDIPARPKGPTGITTSNVTSKGNDGKLLNVSSKMEYWQKGDSPQKVVEITGSTVEKLSAGTYYVRFKAVENTSFSSQAVEVVIGEYVPDAEKTPEAKIDYIDENLIGLIGGEAYHISIGETEEDVTVRAAGSIPFPSDDSWLGKLITIVKKGKSPDSTDSEPQVLKIGTRPKAPSNIKTTPVTSGQNDGTLSGRTADKDKLEYRVSGTSSWIPIMGITQTGLAAGKYDVRFRASNTEEKFASESVTVTVSYAVMTQEPTPTVSIKFKDEQLTGLKFGDEYLIDNTEITVEEGGVFKLPEDWFDTAINIVKAGNGINTTDSDAFELYIPARPSAPTDVETEDISVKGAKGKLLNLRDTMEYRPEDSEKWIPVPNNSTQVTGLAAGIYFVRIKATDSSFCSEEVELIIMDFELNAAATPEAQIDYEKEELTGLIKGTYLISTDDTESSSVNTVKVGTDGRIVIKDKWFGSTLYIVRKGDGYSTENSEAQPLDIPERRDAPDDIVTEKESKKGAKDGKLTNVNNTMAYQKKGAKDWTPIVGDEVGPLAPGVYLVCYKAVIGKDFRSESAEYTISAFELIPADTPDLVEISYEDEYFMYLTPYADYKIDGVTVSADADGKIRIRDAWMKNKEVSIIQLGDGLTTDKSAPHRIKVPGRHSSPSSVKAVSESAEDANDGKLTGVNDKMEYRVADSVEDSEANWIQIDSDTNTVENLEPAKYKIRYMATDNSFASKSVTRTVYAFGAEPKTPDKSKGDSNEEQEIPTDENSDSSQTEDGSAGGGTAGNAGSASTVGSDKNVLADGTDAAAIEENTDENGADTISQNTLTGQNAEIGSGSNSGNNQDNKSNKGNAGKTEPADGASKNDAGLTRSESGSLAETARDGGASVYTERTADRMSAFYDFLLRLADSRNLGWIAIILAEPILFLLLLIYLLSRKKRDAECQTEN